MRALDETRKSKRMYDALADIQKSIRVARHAHLYLDYHPEAGGKEKIEASPRGCGQGHG